MTSSKTAPPSGRFQPPEVRQRQILDAVADLAVAHGLDQVSIAHVAEAAGIAKGSIYLHYQSRQELIGALQADVWDQMLSAPREIAGDASLTWTQRLDLVLEHWVRFEFAHRELYHAVFHATGSESEEPWAESRSLVRTLLRGGADAGEFALVDLEVTADFLLHGYAGPCYHHDDVDLVVTNLQALFHRAVGLAEA